MKRIGLILITIILLLSGCISGTESGLNTNVKGQDYSYDNPDIVAYIDGDPVSQSSLNNYIIMKKEYMKALAKQVEAYSYNGDLEEIYIKWYQEKTKEIIAYSDNDWVEDYYKSIVLSKKFYETVKNADEQIKLAADEEVKFILDYTENKGDLVEDIDYSDAGVFIRVVDDTSLDAVPVIQSVSKKLGISLKECVNSVYKPFWITEYIYDYLLNIRYDELDYGEAVEYTDSNQSEYEAYVLNGMEINENYLNSLFEQAQIVKRP